MHKRLQSYRLIKMLLPYGLETAASMCHKQQMGAQQGAGTRALDAITK
jgi:hypothetical protein